MKLANMFVLSYALLAASTAALAGNAFYDVEVTGLKGLDIKSGETIFQPEPVYPKLALRRALTGEVLVQYSIDAQGKADNIVIVESSPRGFFDSATIRNLQAVTFGRSYEEGTAVPVHGLKKRFIYDIVRENEDSPDMRVSIR
ncbi:MAG: hypothetical protein CMK32_01735 [Porticoccaceae bacterium]|nr:hypothetical protein [Porticoccaceae bacterium]